MANRKTPGKTGRPRFDVDWETVDSLLKIQCTGEEIAGVLGCSYDTIERACKRDKKIAFADYSQQKRNGGKASLRRRQWLAAEEGNPTMLVWLGKQILGQSDKQDLQVSGNVEFVTYYQPKPDWAQDE